MLSYRQYSADQRSRRDRRTVLKRERGLVKIRPRVFAFPPELETCRPRSTSAEWPFCTSTWSQHTFGKPANMERRTEGDCRDDLPCRRGRCRLGRR